MKFPQTFIDEVRSAADIVTVISDYVSLRKAGTSYKGLCPFHGEKTPSFNVNRDKGFFHCFGCGVGGDVFKFIELQESVGFTDSVRQLAQRFGIPVPELEGGDRERESAGEREALLRAHEIAAAWFQEQLASPAGARVREYLRTSRGLTDETVARLGFGWAPPARDGLRQRLVQQGIPAPLIVLSGLVTRRDDGSEVDRFRNRLMVPIARDAGSVIAFGGRALDKDQVPKYLNSPETPIYTKSRALYGLNFTKADLKKSGFAVIVEGYFDFAQVFQAGGLPVVATCGTALTVQQAQLLRRFAPKAILCFDPDTAGQTAAERSCELLVSEGFSVNVALLPGGEDPDTFVQRHGREAYVAELRRSKPYLDFLIDRSAAAHDLTRDDDRREFLHKMLAVAARIPDPAARDQFADRLSHKARVTEEVVRAEIRRAAVQKRTELPKERTPGLAAGGRVRGAEKGLIWGLIHEPASVLPWLAELEPADLAGLETREILEVARAVGNEGVEDVPSALLERLSTKDARLVAAVAAEREPPVLSAETCVHALKVASIERELGALQEEIARVRRDGAPAPDLMDLLRRKNDLRSALDRSARRSLGGL
ncbi:MAG: DNA primase [Vicinamibacterales bacterium]